MYIKDVIQVETSASNQYPNLEIATVNLRLGNFSPAYLCAIILPAPRLNSLMT